MQRKKKTGRRVLSIILSAAMVIPMCSVAFPPLPGQKGGAAQAAEKAVTLSNPRTDENGVSTWDCVYFGSYWQNDTNGDGVADREDEKEPIKWRVLSVDGDDAFLLADQSLDCKPYHTSDTAVTWETCTLRSWLNGYGSGSNACGADYSDDNFFNNTFSQAEQSAIRSTTVVNDDNPEYGTEGGNSTIDKVYLLSIDEASTASYGFDSAYSTDSDTRIAGNTAYAIGQGPFAGMDYISLSDWWWLRSLGFDSNHAANVDDSGRADSHGCNFYSDSEWFSGYCIYAIRPALHLNLKASPDAVSTHLYTYAGTVSSDGKKVQVPIPSDPGPAGSTSNPAAPVTSKPSSDTNLSNPRTDADGVSTWDCVYFGSYWQNDTNGDGVADREDEKEPIKWRVLSVDGDDAFLLADQSLDCKPYNIRYTGVTWGICTLRSWLNGYGSSSNAYGTDYSNDNFIDAAFSQTEQSAIYDTTVINDDNPQYDTEGGNSTIDKVYLLSIDEASTASYGFDSTYGTNSDTRIVGNTAYVKEQGAYTDTAYTRRGSGWWWLRSPGHSSSYAAYVNNGGCGRYNGYSVDTGYNAIRPALHLNLNASPDTISSHPYTYAGTVSSNEMNADVPTSNPGGTLPSVTLPPASGDQTMDPSSPTPQASSSPTPQPATQEPPNLEVPTLNPSTSSPKPSPTPVPNPTAVPTPSADSKYTSLAGKLKINNLSAKYKKVKKSGYLYQPQISVAWDKNSSCDGYEVWRKEGAQGYKSFTEIESSGICTLIDSSVKMGSSYTYKVTAYQSDGDGNTVQGKESVTKSITVSAKLCTPSFTAKNQKRKLIVTFSKAEGKKYESQYQYMDEKQWHSLPQMKGTIKKKIVKSLRATGFRIRIRTYTTVNRKKVYSSWSKSKVIR